jgi:pilus assembly protein Flp/PilA
MERIVNNMLKILVNLLLTNKADRRAVTAIEYALIASLIAVAIIGALSLLGFQIGGVFNTVDNALYWATGNPNGPP